MLPTADVMSMPLVSVVTAALTPTSAHADYLLEAYDSLTIQKDLGAWEWEWLIQEDGEHPRLRERLPDDPRIHYAALGLPLGAAISRNIALERARGELVRVLDSDDVLLPRGLTVPLELLTKYTEAVWAAGEYQELLMPDRQISAHAPFPVVPNGLVRQDLLAELLRESDKVAIHCAGLTIKTDVLRAFGGWMGLPCLEGVIPLLAANIFYPGAFSSEPTFLYRCWPCQTTRQKWLTEINPLGRSVLWQRLDAIRALAPWTDQGRTP